MTFKFIFTIFLVILNGFFVAAEFAIVKVRSSQIEVRKGASKTITNLALSIINNLDGYLAATQLGITLASLGLGWVGESVFTEIVNSVFLYFGLDIDNAIVSKIAIAMAFLLITILHIVFGELAPKSLAIRKSTSVTFAIAAPLHAFYVVFRPFIWLLNGLANTMLKIIGIRPAGEHGEVHSEEELKVIIAESTKGGVLEETEKSLIQNVFILGDRRILSLMTTRKDIVWLDTEDSIEETKKIILANKHNIYPVCEGELDNIVGFVASKDFVSDNLNESISNIRQICRPVFVVTSTSRAYTVLELFRKERKYQAVVVDEFGSVKGLVTINDIVDALVGDISETDEFEYSIVTKEDGSLLVEAQIPFIEFIEKIRPEYMDEGQADFTTLAGYIITELERLPEVGDTVTWHDLRFTVKQMDNTRINEVLVTKNTQPDNLEEFDS